MPSSLLQVVKQLVPNSLQQLGTSSANTTCQQLVSRFVTTCLQTCNNLCVFTWFLRVYDYKSSMKTRANRQFISDASNVSTGAARNHRPSILRMAIRQMEDSASVSDGYILNIRPVHQTNRFLDHFGTTSRFLAAVRFLRYMCCRHRTDF